MVIIFLFIYIIFLTAADQLTLEELFVVPNTSDIPKSSIFLAFPKPLGGILNEIIDDLSVTLMEITGDPVIGWFIF